MVTLLNAGCPLKKAMAHSSFLSIILIAANLNCGRGKGWMEQSWKQEVLIMAEERSAYPMYN